MAKKLSAELLDDLTTKAAKPLAKEYTLRDGNGLFLLVHPNGSKYFQLRTTLHGKSKKIQLGAYPDLTLSKARDSAKETRRMIAEHKDPIIEAKLAKVKEAQNADATFRSVAEVWLDIKKHTLAQSTHLKIAQTSNGVTA